MSTPTAAAALEHRLAAARLELLDLAATLADPDPTLLAAGLESLASLATVMAAELRDEQPLR